jgi:hypothetical protein
MTLSLGFRLGIHFASGGGDLAEPTPVPDYSTSPGVGVTWDPFSARFTISWQDAGQAYQTTLTGPSAGDFLWLVEPKLQGYPGVGNTLSITAGQWFSVTATAPDFDVTVRETDVAGDIIDTGVLPYSRAFDNADRATGVVAFLVTDNGTTDETREFTLSGQGAAYDAVYLSDPDLTYYWDSATRIDVVDTSELDDEGEPTIFWNNLFRVENRVTWLEPPAIEYDILPAIGADITITAGVWAAFTTAATVTATLTREGATSTVTLPYTMTIAEQDVIDGLSISVVADNGTTDATTEIVILEPGAVPDPAQLWVSAAYAATGGTGGNPYQITVSGAQPSQNGTYAFTPSPNALEYLAPAVTQLNAGAVSVAAPVYASYSEAAPAIAVDRYRGPNKDNSSPLAFPYVYTVQAGDEETGVTLRVEISNGPQTRVAIVTLVAQAASGDLALTSLPAPGVFEATGLAAGPVHFMEAPALQLPEYTTVIPAANLVGWYRAPYARGVETVGEVRTVYDGKAYNANPDLDATLSNVVKRGATPIATNVAFPYEYTVLAGDGTSGVTLERTITNGVETSTEVVHIVTVTGLAPVIEYASVTPELLDDPYGDGFDYWLYKFTAPGEHLLFASQGGLANRSLLVGGGSSGGLEWNSNRGEALAGNGGAVVAGTNALFISEGFSSIFVGAGGAGTVAPLPDGLAESVSPQAGDPTIAFGVTAAGATAGESGNGNLPGAKWGGSGTGSNFASGGGAGAGGAGGDAPAQFTSGAAGVGVSNDITGAFEIYGGGANGISDSVLENRSMGATQPNAGVSANNGVPPTAGTDGYGGGGGGTARASNVTGTPGMGGAAGGSGGIYIAIRAA